MHFTSVIYEKRGEIALVRLNRPKVLNAMNLSAWQDLGKAIATAENDSGIRGLILTGEGRAFSSGADLAAAKGRSPDDYREYLDTVQAVSHRLIHHGRHASSGETSCVCSCSIRAHDASNACSRPGRQSRRATGSSSSSRRRRTAR